MTREYVIREARHWVGAVLIGVVFEVIVLRIFNAVGVEWWNPLGMICALAGYGAISLWGRSR